MLINVIDVGTPNTHTAKNGRSYQSMEVTFKNDAGDVKSKKLMSFANADVFKSAQTWEKGTTVNVDAQKDDNGYWQWVGILDGASAPVGEVKEASASVELNTPKPAPKSTRVTGSNYETKDERAERQVMIIRQSSLANAVATLALDKDKGASPEDVMRLAKVYEEYVLGTKPASVEDMMDDIPL